VLEFNFFGPTKIYESIKKIAAQFDDTIKEKAEAMIENITEDGCVIEKYRRSRGQDGNALCWRSPPASYNRAYEDLGMEVVASGYEFGTMTITNVHTGHERGRADN